MDIPREPTLTNQLNDARIEAVRSRVPAEQSRIASAQAPGKLPFPAFRLASVYKAAPVQIALIKSVIPKSKKDGGAHPFSTNHPKKTMTIDRTTSVYGRNAVKRER